MFIFGSCFAPYCILAALPHTSILALILTFFSEKIREAYAAIQKELNPENKSLLGEFEKKSKELENWSIRFSEEQKLIVAKKRKELEERINNSPPLNKKPEDFNFEEGSTTRANQKNKVNNSIETKKVTETPVIQEPKKHFPKKEPVIPLVDSVYITKSNASQLALKTDGLDSSFSELYDSDLSFILTTPELTFLQIYKEVCKSDKDSIKIYKRREKRKDTGNFVWEGGTPAFHSSIGCPVLTSNFLNLEIPPEIKKQGETSIERYRVFVKQNSKLLKENQSSFIDKLEARFLLINRPKSISYSNSGTSQISNYNLEELKATIDELISSAQSFMSSSESTRTIIKNQGYGTHKVKKAKEKGHPLHRWHQYKVDLKRLLKEYYQIRFNPELRFERSLLEQVGFKPCQECFKN